MKYERYLRDKQANGYEKGLSGYHSSIELFLLKSLLPESSTNILDAGCGTGRLIQLLLPLTKKSSVFCGIDLSLKSLFLAKDKIDKERDRIPNIFIQGSVTELPFKSELFDLIVCSEVFEHILKKEDQIKILSEFRRCLKLNGILILSTYNYCIFDKFRKVPKVCNKSDGYKPNYIRLTKEELYNILLTTFEKKEIISTHGGLCLWGVPNKILKIIWHLLPEKFIKTLEFFLFKNFFGSIFGHLLFVKVIKKK